MKPSCGFDSDDVAEGDGVVGDAAWGDGPEEGVGGGEGFVERLALPLPAIWLSTLSSRKLLGVYLKMTLNEFKEVTNTYGLVLIRDEKRKGWILASKHDSDGTLTALVEIRDVEIKFLSDRLIEERVLKALTNSIW